MTNDATHRKTTALGWLLRIALGVVLVVSVTGAVLFGYALLEHRRHVNELADEVQQVRAEGEPLDNGEIQAFFAIPDGSVDLTPSFVEVLQPLVDGGELVTPVKDLKHFGTLLEPGREPPHRPDVWSLQASAERVLKPFQPLLLQLEQETSRQGVVRYPVDYSAGWESLIPYQTACQRATRPLEVQTLVDYHRGDMTRAADRIITIIRLAETLKQDPLLTSQLVRMMLHRCAHRLTAFVAFDADFTAGDLQRIQNEFAVCSFETNLRPALLLERAGGYIVFSQPLLKERAEELGVPTGTVLLKTRPGDCADWLHWQSRGIDLLEMPLANALSRAADVDQQFEWNHVSEARLPQWLQNHVSQTTRMPMRRIVVWFVRGETENQAAIAFCAIERFRRNHERLPESLEELVSDYVDAVPQDPRLSRPPELVPLLLRSDEHGFVVYGRGSDEEDDGGDVYSPDSFPLDFGIRSFRRVNIAP